MSKHGQYSNCLKESKVVPLYMTFKSSKCNAPQFAAFTFGEVAVINH